jgi:hypothetical protein
MFDGEPASIPDQVPDKLSPQNAPAWRDLSLQA